MAPLWQLCERGDLEGVVEALAQVEEAVVEEALRKLTNVVVDIVIEDVEESHLLIVLSPRGLVPTPGYWRAPVKGHSFKQARTASSPIFGRQLFLLLPERATWRL